MIMAMMVMMVAIKIKNGDGNVDNYDGFNDPNYVDGYDDNSRNENGDYEGNDYVNGDYEGGHKD